MEAIFTIGDHQISRFTKELAPIPPPSSDPTWTWADGVEEGGVELDQQEYVLSHNGTDQFNAGVLELVQHAPGIEPHAVISSTIPYLRSDVLAWGSNSICAAKGKLYALVGTERVDFSWFSSTLHLLGGLKIVEFKPDGTLLRTFDFPVPTAWFTPTHGAAPFFQYPGDDSTSIPAIAVDEQGTTIYVNAMIPRPDWGDNTWEQGIFKCDVGTGTVTQLIRDSDLFSAIQAFITANWPDEGDPSSWDPYGFSGFAVLDNGDLLICSNYVPLLVRVDSTGAVKQLFVGQDGPNSPPGSVYFQTSWTYTGMLGLTVMGDTAYTIAGNGGELHIDDGTHESYNMIGSSGDAFLFSWDLSSSDPVVLMPEAGPPAYVNLGVDQPYCIWHGFPPPPTLQASPWRERVYPVG